MLRLQSRLSSIDEFVRSFSYLVDERNLFIVTKSTVPTGLRCRFAVTLRDGQVVFGGDGEIVDSPARLTGPDSPTGMRIRLLHLDAESQAMHARLLARRREREDRRAGPASALASGDEEITAASEATRARQSPPTIPEPLGEFGPSAGPNRPPRSGLPHIPGPDDPPRIPQPPASAPRIPRPDSDPGVPRPDGAASSPKTTASGAEAPARPAQPLEAGTPAPTTATRAKQVPSRAEQPGAPPATARDPGGPTERAVTGSDFILPANPLSELSDAGLHGLIECVIYEDSGVPRETEPDELGEPAGQELAEFERAESKAPEPKPRAPAPPDAPLASATPAHRADSSEEGNHAAGDAVPLPDPPARPARPIRNLRGYLVTAALAAGLAFFLGFLVFADRGSTPPDLEPALGADPVASRDSLSDASSSGGPSDTPHLTADLVDPIDEGEEGAEGDFTDEQGDSDPAGEEVAMAADASPPGDGAGCVARIDSAPRGARVTVDGDAVGATPVTDLAVECGVELSVLVERTGFRDHRQRITASPEAPVELSARLQRSMSRLRVVTTPPGATVTINGKFIGSAPVTARVRHSKSIRVTASLRGHKLWARQFRPKRDRVTLRAQLERIGR